MYRYQNETHGTKPSSIYSRLQETKNPRKTTASVESPHVRWRLAMKASEEMATMEVSNQPKECLVIYKYVNI